MRVTVCELNDSPDAFAHGWEQLASTLRRGFSKACELAEIPFGQTVEAGMTWHDLRRTFATELRGRQVHESTSPTCWATRSKALPARMLEVRRKRWKML